jgi:hypothetical protein
MATLATVPTEVITIMKMKRSFCLKTQPQSTPSWLYIIVLSLFVQFFLFPLTDCASATQQQQKQGHYFSDQVNCCFHSQEKNEREQACERGQMSITYIPMSYFFQNLVLFGH